MTEKVMLLKDFMNNKKGDIFYINDRSNMFSLKGCEITKAAVLDQEDMFLLIKKGKGV